MTKSFTRLVVLAFLGTGLVPLVTVTRSSLNVQPRLFGLGRAAGYAECRNSILVLKHRWHLRGVQEK